MAKQPIDPKTIWQQTAQKAYELFEERGFVHGYDLDDWLKAEQIILNQGKPKKIAKSTRARTRTTQSKSLRKTSPGPQP